MSNVRIRAKDKHPTIQKVEKLFAFLDELKLEVSFYSDRIFINDLERKDKDWELTDEAGISFATEMPCMGYQLCQDQEQQVTIAGMVPREIPRYKKDLTK